MTGGSPTGTPGAVTVIVTLTIDCIPLTKAEPTLNKSEGCCPPLASIAYAFGLKFICDLVLFDVATMDSGAWYLRLFIDRIAMVSSNSPS